MVRLLIVVSVCFFILIVYFALSKGSSPLIKRTAVIALILIGIAVLVSLCILFSEPTVTLNTKPLTEIPPERPVPIKVVKSTPILIMAILLLLFIAWAVCISLRDQRREQQKQAQQRRIDNAEEKPSHKIT